MLERESQTERESEGMREGGMRWRGIQQGAHCQTFTTPSLLKQCKVRAGPKSALKGTHTHTHTDATTYICTLARRSGCVVDLPPSGYDEVRIFPPCFHLHRLLSTSRCLWSESSQEW